MSCARVIIPSTQEYINYIKTKIEIMDGEVCTSTAKQIMEALGSNHATGCEDMLAYLHKSISTASAIQDGLYNLTVTWGVDMTNTVIGGMNLWQHGLVLQKSSVDMILYQAFVGVYPLKDWLANAHTGKISKNCWRDFSPESPQYTDKNMQVWLDLLVGLRNAADKGDIEAFSLTSEALFGAKPTKVDVMKLEAAVRQKIKIRFDWKFAHLKSIGDLK